MGYVLRLLLSFMGFAVVATLQIDTLNTIGNHGFCSSLASGQKLRANHILLQFGSTMQVTTGQSAAKELRFGEERSLMRWKNMSGDMMPSQRVQRRGGSSWCSCINLNASANVSVACHPNITSERIQVVGAQLLVNGKPFHIKGINWSPVQKGRDNRGTSFRDFLERDGQLMQEAGINVVRIYGTLSDKFVLDALWARGIWVIPTVYAYGRESPLVVAKRVEKVKDHPAILMWAIGNEWNYNGIYSGLNETEAIGKIRAAAIVIKQHDDRHPVSTIFGEVPSVHIVEELEGIDVWGITSYRGLSFGGLFKEWEVVSTKPMFLAEYGADAYDTTKQREDQHAQAFATTSLTHEIVEHSVTRGGRCVGGFLFELADEWWKVFGGSEWFHDTDGFARERGPYPDLTFNEEWWGIVDIDRKPRLAYEAYKKTPNPGYNGADDIC